MNKTAVPPAPTLSEEDVKNVVDSVSRTLTNELLGLSTRISVVLEDALRFAPLAAELRRGREAKGWDLKAAAKALKATQYKVQQLECGNVVQIEPGTVERYAALLGLGPVYSRWRRTHDELAARLEVIGGQNPLVASVEGMMLDLLMSPRRAALDPPARTGSRSPSGAGLATRLTLKVTLADIEPAIWRRIEVSSDATLHELHQAIQAAMGWRDSHLYEFDAGARGFGDLDLFDDPPHDMKHAKKVRIRDLGLAPGAEIEYRYDLGDDWNHLVTVESVDPLGSTPVPRCTGGERACPPEDSGGPHSYPDLLEALRDPKHPEHRDSKEWVGEKFDPERFDLRAAGARLAVLGRARKPKRRN